LARRLAGPAAAASGRPATTNPHPDFPGLGRQHLTGARLFADRYDLVTTLVTQRGLTVAEVGVGYGDFSAAASRTSGNGCQSTKA
jgi:hypothetical protein